MIDPQFIDSVGAHISGKRVAPRRIQSLAALLLWSALLYRQHVNVALMWIKFPRSTMAFDCSVANLWP